MKYQITTLPGDSLRPLKTHMAQYAIDAKYKAATIMSDGSAQAVGGFPIFTLTGGAGASLLAMAGVAVNPVAGLAGGLILDMLFGGKGSQDAPYPALQIVEVSWRNVSRDRALWAEYLLCKLCERQGWQIHTDLLDARNAGYAKRNSKAPRPWKQRRDRAGVMSWMREIFK